MYIVLKKSFVETKPSMTSRTSIDWSTDEKAQNYSQVKCALLGSMHVALYIYLNQGLKTCDFKR